MKTKNQTSPTGRTVKVAGMNLKASSTSLTIGLDLGDNKHSCCVLDAQGKVLKKETIANERPALKKLAADWPEALIVMEAGTHSPWISRFFKDLGHRVLVANPRKVRTIYKAELKSDDRDAELLARIAWVDGALLPPVEHGDEKQQRDILAIKLREALVRSRAGIINTVRFTLKSLGHARRI